MGACRPYLRRGGSGICVAVLQFPDFFSNQPDALGKQELKILGFTFKAVTLREGAFLSTIIVACFGAITGAALGLIFGLVAAFKSR